MAHQETPHFHNNPGVPVIQIGAKQFKCMGATPPYDHPHIFLDMGSDTEIICPYCSTLYKFGAELQATETEPADCFYAEAAEKPAA